MYIYKSFIYTPYTCVWEMPLSFFSVWYTSLPSTYSCSLVTSFWRPPPFGRVNSTFLVRNHPLQMKGQGGDPPTVVTCCWWWVDPIDIAFTSNVSESQLMFFLNKARFGTLVWTRMKKTWENILLVEEILHHLQRIKLCKSCDTLAINWCRISQ